MNSKNEVLTKGFTQIPNSHILAGENLTDGEFRFYCTLKCHMFQKDFCFPGRGTIAKEMGASIAKVDRIKRSAVQKGLITKTRRGQGITNLYKPKTLFFFEADESLVSGLNKASIKRKEDKDNNTKINNYPDNQISNEISYKENTTNSVPPAKTSNEVIFRVMIKRTINSILQDKLFLKELSIQKSELELAGEVLIYYVVKYKAVLGEEHPRYIQDQVKRCYLGFIEQVQILRNYGWSLEFVYGVLRQVIDRWFLSSKKDRNKLRLNSYFGKWDNKIFFECLKYAGLE
jgi:hypothetical protein